MNARHGNGAAVGHDFDGQIAVVLLSWNDFRMQMNYRKEQLLRRLLELLLLRWRLMLLRRRRQRMRRRWMLNNGRSHQPFDRFRRLIRSCIYDDDTIVTIVKFGLLLTQMNIIKICIFNLNHSDRYSSNVRCWCTDSISSGSRPWPSAQSKPKERERVAQRHKSQI